MKRATEKLITAAEANRRFSELLRGVREGGTYIVTVHGKPVAKVMPAGEADVGRDIARRALLARLRAQSIVKIGPWKRDDLYEDGL